MIFVGICLYFLLGIIFYMGDRRMRDLLVDEFNEYGSYGFIIFAFIMLLMVWLPMRIYGSFLNIIRHNKDGSN
jgi:hypothetical protein